MNTIGTLDLRNIVVNSWSVNCIFIIKWHESSNSDKCVKIPLDEWEDPWLLQMGHYHHLPLRTNEDKCK